MRVHVASPLTCIDHLAHLTHMLMSHQDCVSATIEDVQLVECVLVIQFGEAGLVPLGDVQTVRSVPEDSTYDKRSKKRTKKEKTNYI